MGVEKVLAMLKGGTKGGVYGGVPMSHVDYTKW